VLDDSTGFRTRLYWAQLIVIGVVMPLSFVLNKLWTFNAMRDVHRREREARAGELVGR
jgi:putative flippase GtrA